MESQVIYLTSGSIAINTTGGNEKLNVHGAIRSSAVSVKFSINGLKGTLVDYDLSNKFLVLYQIQQVHLVVQDPLHFYLVVHEIDAHQRQVLGLSCKVQQQITTGQ